MLAAAVAAVAGADRKSGRRWRERWWRWCPSSSGALGGLRCHERKAGVATATCRYPCRVPATAAAAVLLVVDDKPSRDADGRLERGLELAERTDRGKLQCDVRSWSMLYTTTQEGGVMFNCQQGKSARAFMYIIVQAAAAAAVACRASFHQDSATEASLVSVCPTVRAGERRGRRLRDANLLNFKSNPPHRQTDKPDATGTRLPLASFHFSSFTAYKKKHLLVNNPYHTAAAVRRLFTQPVQQESTHHTIAGRSENAQHGRLPNHQTPTQGRLNARCRDQNAAVV